MIKKTLSLDFDGVTHSYSSGWLGPTKIPDPPVEGAIEFIVKVIEVFDVNIYSSRSRYGGGCEAMRSWLQRWLCVYVIRDDDPLGVAHMTRPELNAFVARVVDEVKFPRDKPAAFVGLDDRVLTFTPPCSAIGRSVGRGMARAQAISTTLQPASLIWTC